MRTHVFGWVALGLAVFALPWDTRHNPRPVDKRSDMAASVAGVQHQRPSMPAPAAIAAAPMSSAAPGPDIVEGAASQARPGEPVSAPTRTVPGPAAPATPPFAAGPALAVREFAPGSKAHAEVIAKSIASEEFQDAVTPLARLYLAYFGRVPDYEGFDHYIGERERGEPLEAIADEFAGSAEFSTRYGVLDNGAFVDRVHLNIFGSSASAEARAYWVDQIESGRLTRGQVMLAFSESPGYRAMTAHEVFVAIAYAETLRRAPDPAALARWVAFLAAGNPPRAVIDALLADRGKG